MKGTAKEDSGLSKKSKFESYVSQTNPLFLVHRSSYIIPFSLGMVRKLFCLGKLLQKQVIVIVGEKNAVTITSTSAKSPCL